MLEKIGNRCFSGSGIEEFRAPPSLRSIGNEAFILCKCLKLAILNEGLERLVTESVYYDKNGAYTQYNGIFCESGL